MWQVFPERTPGIVQRERPGQLITGALPDVFEQLVGANLNRHGVSITINQTDGQGRRVENVTRARALWLDFDHGAPGSFAPLDPSIVVRTPRGCHAYWLLNDGDGTDIDRWIRIQRALAKAFRNAEEDADAVKAMRCPGFLHQKRDPTLVELEYCEPSRRWWASDIVEAFELRVVERQATDAARAAGEVPLAARLAACERYVAACKQIVQGRGETWAASKAMCGIGGDFGLEVDQFWPLLVRWNEGNTPPLDEGELYRKLQRVHALRRDPFGFRLERVDRSASPPARTVVREAVLPDAPWPEDDDASGALLRDHADPGPGPELDEGPEPIPPPEPPADLAEFPEPAPPTGALARRSPERAAKRGAPDPEAPPTPPPGLPKPPRDFGSGDGKRRFLDRDAPLETAKVLVDEKFRIEGLRIVAHHQRAWYVWNGRHYREVSREDMNARIYDFLAPALHTDEKGNPVPFNPDETRVNKVRHALQAVGHLDDDRKPPCWTSPPATPTDAQPPTHELVSCRNGLLHLPSRRWLGRRPDYFSLTSLGVDYNPNAPEPKTWLKFLDALWPEDEVSIELLQEWFGLSLVPDTSFQKMLFVVGPRRSGKGTIARVLSDLHGGEGNCAWLSMTDLVSRFGLHPLLDKSVAIMPDVRISPKLDQSEAVEKILRITGEDSLSVDRKNLPVIHAQIGARFMLMSNLAPRLSDAGAAFVSRMLVLKMESSFLGREDRDLKRKLVGEVRGTKRVGGELEGILNWAIAGWERLVSRGRFVQPDSSREIVDDMAEMSTPVVAFVRSCCTTEAPEDWVHSDHLFNAWRKWCETEGREAVGEKSTFVRNLRSAFPKIRSKRNRAPTGARVKVLYGIRLLTELELDALEREAEDGRE